MNLALSLLTAVLALIMLIVMLALPIRIKVVFGVKTREDLIVHNLVLKDVLLHTTVINIVKLLEPTVILAMLFRDVLGVKNLFLALMLLFLPASGHTAVQTVECTVTVIHVKIHLVVYGVKMENVEETQILKDALFNILAILIAKVIQIVEAVTLFPDVDGVKNHLLAWMRINPLAS